MFCRTSDLVLAIHGHHWNMHDSLFYKIEETPLESTFNSIDEDIVLLATAIAINIINESKSQLHQNVQIRAITFMGLDVPQQDDPLMLNLYDVTPRCLFLGFYASVIF